MCNLCSPIYCIPIALGWEKGPNNDDDDQDDFTISTVISENTKRVPNEKPRRCSEMIRRCFLSSSKVETEEETPTKEDERTIQPPVLEPELDLAYAGETIRWQADDEEEEKDRAPFCFICLEDFGTSNTRIQVLHSTNIKFVIDRCLFLSFCKFSFFCFQCDAVALPTHQSLFLSSFSPTEKLPILKLSSRNVLDLIIEVVCWNGSKRKIKHALTARPAFGITLNLKV